MASQDDLRAAWEARHGRSGAIPAKGATMPPISYAEAHPAGAGYYPSPPPATKAGSVSHLTPELAAQVEDMTLDRHVVQLSCCREAERAGQSWDGKCAKHQGTPAQRAEHRRWQAKAAAVTLAQTLGRTTDHVRVVNYDQAAQEDSHFGPGPVVDRVYFVP